MSVSKIRSGSQGSGEGHKIRLKRTRAIWQKRYNSERMHACSLMNNPWHVVALLQAGSNDVEEVSWRERGDIVASHWSLCLEGQMWFMQKP